MEAAMGTSGDEEQADAHREAMERLCREYGEALKTYDMAKAAGDSALAAQLELVVAEKSNVMQAYMERSRDGTGAALH
jgi:hypothetical protein